MPAYLVKATLANGKTLVNGLNAAIVFAANSTDAKAYANAMSAKDAKGFFDSALVTEIAEPDDFLNHKVEVTIYDPSAGALPLLSVTVQGATLDSLDILMSKVVTALNNTSSISNAAYDSGTNILTAAGAADNLGHMFLKVEVKPTEPGGPGENPIPGLVQSITDQGVPSDPLTAQMAANGYVRGRGYSLVRTEL